MRELDVVYCGNGLSGMSTSVTRVLADLRRLEPRGANDIRVATICGDVEVVVRIRVSKRRAWLGYTSLADSHDPGVRQEAEWFRTAHAVVLVLDSRRARQDAVRYAIGRLTSDCVELGIGQPATVYQLNRRDDPTAVPVEEVTAALEGPINCVESIATLGVGVLEAFQRSVKLALLKS